LMSYKAFSYLGASNQGGPLKTRQLLVKPTSRIIDRHAG
jgi:hypothetical protein